VTSGIGPTLPIRDVRFHGEFRRDNGRVVLTVSFVDFDPQPKSRPEHLVSVLTRSAYGNMLPM